MTRILKWSVLVLLAACATKGVTHLVHTSGDDSLVVVIEGVRSEEGQILVGLFASAEGFPGSVEGSRAGEVLAARTPSVTVEFPDLEPGTYAISVLHDENGNSTMERDFMGRPSEGWTVSNDARGRFGPPSFEDAAVNYRGGRATLTVNLSY